MWFVFGVKRGTLNGVFHVPLWAEKNFGTKHIYHISEFCPIYCWYQLTLQNKAANRVQSDNPMLCQIIICRKLNSKAVQIFDVKIKTLNCDDG